MSYTLHAPHIWRYMLALAMVPGILLLIGTFFVPASPHWLVSEGRFTEALKVLKKLRETPREVRKEMAEMRKQERLARKGPSVKALLKERWVIRVLLTGCGLGFVAQFTGVNAFMYYTPIILKTTGMGTNASIAATIGNGIVSVLATLVGIWAVSRFSRRHMLMTGLSIVILTQIALGLTLTLLPQNLTQSYLALACILVFLFFMQMCISPVYWLLMSELAGTAVCFQWICNATVAFAFPLLLSVIGNQTFFLFVLLNIGSFIFVFFMLPETRGKSLEEIENMMRSKYGEV